jgi:hypothetical protein
MRIMIFVASMILLTTAVQSATISQLYNQNEFLIIIV